MSEPPAPTGPGTASGRMAVLAGLGEAHEQFGRLTVTVSAQVWVTAAQAARDDLGLAFFDFLSAAEEPNGDIAVVAHLAAASGRPDVLLRCVLPGAEPAVDTLTGLYRGAGWHERETAEMFGVSFRGHPDPRPLLLRASFGGHPLRKSFPLASRGVKAWPGAFDPAPVRRPPVPPGRPQEEPAAGSWPEPSG